MPLLELALRGARQEQAGAAKPIRLPITPRVLYRLWEVWNKIAADHNAVMMWAVCCVGFFYVRIKQSKTDPFRASHGLPPQDRAAAMPSGCAPILLGGAW
jgi:hypothetical protein